VQRKDDATMAALSAGWLLNAKGVAQQALAERALLARGSTDRATAELALKLTVVRRQLAALTSADFKAEEANEHRDKVARLSEQEETLSRKLGQSTGRPLRDNPWVEMAELRKAMDGEAVLVEISRFNRAKFPAKGQALAWHGEHFAAWIIPPQGQGDVRLIDLGPAGPIDAAAQAVRRALGDAPSAIRDRGETESEKAMRAPLTDLATLVLHPLLPHISDKKQWIVSPDASLWLVPWAALPIADGQYAVERHEIRYVVSGRDLVTPAAADATKPRTNAPLMLADPNYDLGLAEAAAETRRVLQRDAEPLALRAAAESLGKVRWARLPGTAAEAEAIAPNLEKFAGHEPYVYRENYALEGVLKAFARPRVAVLSTHGFFLADEEAANSGVPSSSQSSDRPVLTKQGKLVENPLLRCGLVLAGANHKSTDADLEDGVLTGLEIVSLDLRGTELVVLSACETGLGDVRNGEGVAGLRQAFQLAGAQSVVATLWQIPDRDSALLMNDFFDQLAKGRGKAEALREAQLARIKARRERNDAAHPFFWAAFTLTGQDRAAR
jgi:CHAT domain-containing protein